MIYLSGHVSLDMKQAMIKSGMGLIVQPHTRYDRHVRDFTFWGADNACFNARWQEDRWMRWLERLPRDRCLFAVAPDVYADAQATLDRSLVFFEVIREMGFPVALVAQDGAENLDLPWDEFDVLFIGGRKTPNPADEWKIGEAAERLARRARDKGKWVHMGRCNSQLRLVRAREMGCNSVDGTFIKYRRRLRKREDGDFRPARGVVEIASWMDWLDDNPSNRVFEMPQLPVHRQAALMARGNSAPRP